MKLHANADTRPSTTRPRSPASTSELTCRVPTSAGWAGIVSDGQDRARRRRCCRCCLGVAQAGSGEPPAGRSVRSVHLRHAAAPMGRSVRLARLRPAAAPTGRSVRLARLRPAAAPTGRSVRLARLRPAAAPMGRSVRLARLRRGPASLGGPSVWSKACRRAGSRGSGRGACRGGRRRRFPDVDWRGRASRRGCGPHRRRRRRLCRCRRSAGLSDSPVGLQAA
jgi:hypothetical protein